MGIHFLFPRDVCPPHRSSALPALTFPSLACPVFFGRAAAFLASPLLVHRFLTVTASPFRTVDPLRALNLRHPIPAFQALEATASLTPPFSRRYDFGDLLPTAPPFVSAFSIVRFLPSPSLHWRVRAPRLPSLRITTAGDAPIFREGHHRHPILTSEELLVVGIQPI